MKKNKPKFKLDDTVSFYIRERSSLNSNEKQKLVTGKVYIVDENGTWMNPDTVSYDIMVQETPGDAVTEPHYILYKHVPESWLKRVRTKNKTSHERIYQ